MTKITKFERSNLKTINAEMRAALKAVADKHGLDIDLGTLRFRDTSFTVKITGNVVDTESTSAADSEPAPTRSIAIDLKNAMTVYKIRAEVNAKGDRLISYHPNRPKYPFVFESIRGARWKASVEQAQDRFGRAA